VPNRFECAKKIANSPSLCVKYCRYTVFIPTVYIFGILLCIIDIYVVPPPKKKKNGQIGEKKKKGEKKKWEKLD